MTATVSDTAALGRECQRDAGRALLPYLLGATWQVVGKDLELKNCRMGRVEGAGEVSAEGSLRVFRDGFVVLCNIVKPVTAVNAPYLSKRWASLQAACSSEGIGIANWQDIGGLSEEKVWREANSVIPYLDKALILTGLQVISENVLLHNIKKQLLLVFSWAGMTTLRIMALYCHRPPNCGILMPGVLAEVTRFASAVKEVEDAHPLAFQFLRTTHPERLADLDAKKFPNLAYVAMATAYSAKTLGKQGQFGFKLDDLGVDAKFAQAFIRVRISASTEISAEDREALGVRGVRDDDIAHLMRAIQKNLKRKSQDDSEEDD